MRPSRRAPLLFLLFLLTCPLAGVASAQESAPQEVKKQATASSPDSLPRPQTSTPAPEAVSPHRFWDQKNAWLFAGVGAARTLDYSSTLNMRRRGRQEILLTNEVVDNHAAFAVIETAAAGVSIGASYLFHRYNHHRLERWTSILHISWATSGAVRNYCLKTAHGPPALATP